MMATFAGVIVTVVFMGFSLYRTMIGIMPIVDWLLSTPKYARGIRNFTTRPELSQEAN